MDANDTEAERTAVVYVTWPGAEQVQLAVRQAPGEGGMSWVFDVQIENREVTLNVTPSDDAQAYFADIQYYDVYEQMGLTPKEFAESVVADMIAFYGEAAGMTPEEVIAGMSIYGPASKPYGVIMPGTKYIAFAFALSGTGEVVSDVKIENFETPPADPSDNRISIRVDNVTARTADVYYTTTNSALDWDVDYTLVAMVRNDAGDAYKRFVQEVRFTKQGASPIGELTSSAQPAPLCTAPLTGFRPLAAEGRAVDRSEASRRAEWKALARQTERQYPFGALPFGRIDARR